MYRYIISVHTLGTDVINLTNMIIAFSLIYAMQLYRISAYPFLFEWVRIYLSSRKSEWLAIAQGSVIKKL